MMQKLLISAKKHFSLVGDRYQRNRFFLLPLKF